MENIIESKYKKSPPLLRILILTINNYCFDLNVTGVTSTKVECEFSRYFIATEIDTKIIPEDYNVFQKSINEYVTLYDIIITIGGSSGKNPIGPSVSRKFIDKPSNNPLMELYYLIQSELNIYNLVNGVKSYESDDGEIKRVVFMNFPFQHNLAQMHCMNALRVMPILLNILYWFKHNDNNKRYLKLQYDLEFKYNVFNIEEALEIIKLTFATFEMRCSRSRPVKDSTGFVLAENVFCENDVYVAATSNRKGYACRSNDTSPYLTIIDYNSCNAIIYGQCVEIKPDYILPNFANCVVSHKDVSLIDKYSVVLLCKPEPFQNIQPEIHYETDQLLFERGKLIDSYVFGLLTMLKIKNIRVYRKPYVALIQISNSIMKRKRKDKEPGASFRNLMLGSMIRKMGFKCYDYDIVPYKTKILISTINTALTSNNVLILTYDSNENIEDIESVLMKNFNCKIMFNHLRVLNSRKIIFAHCKHSKIHKFIFVISGDALTQVMINQILIIPGLLYWTGLNDCDLLRLNVRIEEDIEQYDEIYFIRARLKHSAQYDSPIAAIIKTFNDLAPIKISDIIIQVPPSNGLSNVIKKGSILQALMMKSPK